MPNFGSLFYKPKKNDKEISAKRWNIFSILGKAISKTCTVIGAIILVIVLLSVLLVSSAGNTKKPLPSDMVLVFKVEDGLAEIPTRPSLLEPFPFMQPTIRNVIDTLDKARKDERVRGLVVNLKGGTLNIAHIQELRSAIARFRESGKFAKIYASSYGDDMGGLTQYYFASAFDEIWMQPVGMMAISGPDFEMPFAKDALDKLGVSAQFFQREEYKSAMENFTNSEMSSENLETLRSIIGNLSARMMEAIANDRDMQMFDIGKYIDYGLLTGQEALDAKLIDRLDYGDVLVSEIRKDATGDPDDDSVALVTLAEYSQHKSKPPKNATLRKDVALIYAVGTIVDMAGAQGNAGADEISNAIAEAYDDDNIEVIVIRVDSPGGSPSASETIRRAIVKAKEKGKKVIISMGPVAASGGYWISADADKIFALPGTLTGSIGVVMGKFEGSELWKKLGINWQGPQMGGNADIFSINSKFDERATDRLNALIDSTYDSFVTIVANGRNMEVDRVREIAKGRAYTGEQAKVFGLVDEMGGLRSALEEAAKMVGAESSKDINIIRMPRERNKFEQIMALFGQEVSLGKFLQTFLGMDSKFLSSLRGVVNEAKLVQENKTIVYDADLEALR